MNKFFYIVVLMLLLPVLSWAGGSRDSGYNLNDAIEQSADQIAGNLPAGSRVAIVAFESEHDNISDYIMEELTGALFDRNIEVADRQNLEYVFRELRLSGEVNDESAKTVGKFLAADMVITGQLLNLDSMYRYRTNAINVETAVRASVTRLDVRSDNATQRMLAAITRQQTTTMVAKYGVSADVTPQTAGAFFDRGIMFMRQGDNNRAVLDFTDAIRLDPNMGVAFHQRGIAHGFIQENDKAIADFNETIRLWPGNIRAYVLRGFQYVRKGNYDLAFADFNQALRMDPGFAPAYQNRGFAYSLTGNHTQAIADYNQAIRLDQNNNPTDVAFSLMFRGLIYQDIRNLDMAIADFTEAIRLDPNLEMIQPSIYESRARAYAGRNEWDKAISDMEKYLQFNPNDAQAQQILEAMRQQKSQSDAQAYYRRGIAYDEMGDIDRAIAELDQAIRIDPNFAQAYYSRGIAHSRRDRDRAIADYTSAIRLNPNFADAYNNRSLLYLIRGDNDLAIADCNELIRINPNHVDAYNNRGLAYMRSGDNDRAIADFAQAIRLNPRYMNAYFNRGLAYAIKSDFNRAIADWEAVLRLDPNHADTQRFLEQARQDRERQR